MSNTCKIAVVVGSLRAESINRKLATALAHLAPAGVSFEQVAIDALPLYNQDLDGQQPAAVETFKNHIAAAQGVLFVTPEYNRSIPGVLKNAIDHGSRPHGKSVWGGKPAGVIGTSPGAAGTAMAQQHLRNVLSAVGMLTMSQPDAFVQATEGLFDAQGHIGNERSQKFLQNWVNSYIDWVKKQQS